MTSSVEQDVSEDTPGFHLFAKLGLSIESLKAELVKNRERETRRLANLPTYQVFEQMSAPGAATFDVVDFGSPQPGRTWVIRLVGAIPAVSPSLSVPTSNHPANPAAGADITMTVPAGQQWTLQSFTATLTTSATVANRTVTVVIDDGVNTVFTWVSPVVQTATQVVTYTGYPGAVNAAAVSGGVLTFNLPAITMAAGWRIRTVTTNIQAADQWSAIDASYLLTAGAGVATFYIGQKIAAVAGVLPQTWSRWQLTAPGFQSFTSNVHQVLPNQHLLVGLTGLQANAFTSLVVGLNEQPLYQQQTTVAVE